MLGVSRRRLSTCTIPDHAARRIDGAVLDHYEVISQLARGGTSTVYLGEHRATGARVAIKALDAYYVAQSEMVLRLLGEYDLARRAHHPGLVEVHDAAQTPHGIPYVVMEYLDGERLGARFARERLSMHALLAIGAQIASAVAALHAAGIVHCDLKPDNVLVLRELGPDGRPRIKVIDYGVARLLDEPPLTDGEVVGTPSFMAPEQWRGAPAPASDVYALGCLLYELLTGAPPFAGPLPQLMVAHCERAPERPSMRVAVDAAVEQLILRALSKDPTLRPSMFELAAMLGEQAALATRAADLLEQAVRRALAEPRVARRSSQVPLSHLRE